MVKAYLRYEPAGTFGVISSNANVVYDNCGRSLITSALESALVWNIKQGCQVRCGDTV
jgi:U3 small nucleolar RNA-associated protein 12